MTRSLPATERKSAAQATPKNTQTPESLWSSLKQNIECTEDGVLFGEYN